MKIDNTVSIEDIFNELELEEHTLYKAHVRHNKYNPSHVAFLFTGFKNGSYCEIYNNNYDSMHDLESMYEISIIKKLCKTR